MKVKNIVLFSFLLFSCQFLLAQQPIDTLIQKFDQYRKQNLQEKIYVHLDRTNFISGETVWLKLYCVNGTTHQPLDISKVAYIEVLTEKNESILQSKIALDKGFGNGSVFIPATINTGNYIIRVYTRWMKNYGAEFFFHQPVTIINTFRDPEINKINTQVSVDAQFLPEGGNLVEGVSATVAYRVTDKSGKGISFKGYVTDQNNDTLVRFEPLRFGIGKFMITPDASKEYRVIVKTSNNSRQTFKLPAIYPEGYSLHLEDANEKINLHVNVKFQKLSIPMVYLIVHTRNQIVYAEKGFLNDGKAIFTIDKASLREGVSHLTLFNGEQQPVCERLFFKKPAKEIDIKVNSDHTQYNIREKVKLSFDVSTNDKADAHASLSLSVVKIDSLENLKQTDILSYMMLTSDLHSEVESPDYYFRTGTEAEADNLMLTHGWRRFSWKKILTEKNPNPQYIPELQGHIVTGNVVDESGKTAANIKTFLSYPSKKISLSNSFSKGDGSIQFVLKDFAGVNKIFLQTNLSEDSVHQISIDNPFSKVYAPYAYPSLRLRPGMKDGISARSIAMQVQNIFQEETPTSKISDSSSFYGQADETYFLDNYTRFTVMEEVMREYVPGVFVRKRKGNFYFIVLDKPHRKVFNEAPLVLMDGVPIFDIDKLMAFDPLKVKKLEVVTSAYFLGQMTFPGVVSYSTYTGDLAGFTVDPKTIVIDYEALQLGREFYSPQYANETQRNSRLPDQRHLLFWQPSVEIKNGRAEVEFYSSDLSGTYSVQVQGLTTSGLMGSAEHTFIIKRFNN